MSRLLHWVTAAVIIGNVGIGFTAHRLSMEYVTAKVELFSIHKTLGVAAFFVAIARIIWTLAQPHPGPVHGERRAEVFLASTVHWVLYVSMLAVPLSGWIEHAATDGFAPILWPFGQDLPLVPKSAALAAVMASVHALFAWSLCAAVALHVAGALKHALIDRDGVLQRMTRGISVGPRRGEAARAAPPGLAPALIGVGALVAVAGFAVTTSVSREAQETRLQQVASTWTVTQGALGFSIVQMGTPVKGNFSGWTAAIEFDEASRTGTVDATIDIASLSLGTVSDQAKGPEFLDAAAHPTAKFVAQIEPRGDNYVARGSLNLRGVDVPVELPFAMTLSDGTATMSGEVELDRREWQVGAGYSDETTVGFPVTVIVSLTAKR